MVSAVSKRYIKSEDLPKFDRRFAMMNYWMIALFVVLRIGIPAAVLLSLGEVLKRRNQYPGNLRGA
jgi:membrane protein insertase Oxa1/YidC/SpoIIIJ